MKEMSAIGLLLVALSGCPERPAQTTQVAQEGGVVMQMVKVRTDIEARSGQEVEVLGTLKQVPLQLGPGDPQPATGIVLDDQTRIWVTYGEPPPGWAPLFGQRIRVKGRIWNGPSPERKSAVDGAHLSDWGKPEPAGK